MKALFRMIFGHTEAQGDGGAEGQECLTRRRGGAEDFGNKGERKDGRMNHAGTLLEFATEAEAA